MILYIDVGNTNTKWAVGDTEAFFDQGSFANQQPFPATLLDHSVESCWISSVADSHVSKALVGQVNESFGVTANMVKVTGQAAGMRNGYRSQDRLGVDRWMAALGSRFYAQKGGIVVIDAGTAVTVDYVSPENVFEGGVIVPGVKLMHDALVGSTAGIDSRPAEVESVIGKTTSECVNSGVLFGLAGAIERITDEMLSNFAKTKTEALSGQSHVFICGGDAVMLAKLLPAFYIQHPDLVLRGLQVISAQEN